jgi:hypothetical protein
MPLGGAQFFEVGEDPFSGLLTALAVRPHVFHDLFAGQNCLSDFIKHGEPDYTTPRAGQA